MTTELLGQELLNCRLQVSGSAGQRFSQETHERKAKEQCKVEGERAIEERQRMFAGWKERYQKSPYEGGLVQSSSGISSTRLALQILFSMLNKTFPTNSPIAAPPMVTPVSGSWLEGSRLLETGPACCHKYSSLFLHRKLPRILPSELSGEWTHTKAKLCKNRNVPMICTLQDCSAGEKAALWNTVLPSISIRRIHHRVMGGILHNWRTRFSFCWPQCLYKKDLRVWLGRKDYLYLIYWRNCSRTVNPCENIALKCCWERWLCCYLPCQCQSVSNSFLPCSMQRQHLTKIEGSFSSRGTQQILSLMLPVAWVCRPFLHRRRVLVPAV